MWDVIRRSQGLPLNECAYDTYTPAQHYEQNQKIILAHETRAEIPTMDPTHFSKAYDGFLFPKIRRWLVDEDPRLRGQALAEMITLYVEKRENCVTSLDYDALMLLTSIMCTDEVPELREQAATALGLLVKEPKTQCLILALEEGGGSLLQRFLVTLNDPEDGVVVLGLRVMVACHAVHNQFKLTELLVKLRSIEQFVRLLRHENTFVRAMACSALVPIFDVKEAFTIFLKNAGMAATTEALACDDAMLIAEAADVLSRAAESSQGKRDAVACNSVAALLPYVGHTNLTVRVAVAAALAQLTLLETAKAQAIEDGLPEAILRLIPDEDERDVLVYVAKVSYNISEHPKGRALLRSARDRFGELLQLAGDDEAISRALTDAMEILTRFRKFPHLQM